MRKFLLQYGASLALVALRPLVVTLIMFKHGRLEEEIYLKTSCLSVGGVTRRFTNLVRRRWRKDIQQ